MNSLADRIYESERSGYWAIQVRLEPASDVHRRYLCHAQNEPAAAAIAGRLMGPALNVRGYRMSWIDETLLEALSGVLPAIGESRPVGDPDRWATLLAASAQSEAAQHQRRSAL